MKIIFEWILSHGSIGKFLGKKKTLQFFFYFEKYYYAVVNNGGKLIFFEKFSTFSIFNR